MTTATENRELEVEKLVEENLNLARYVAGQFFRKLKPKRLYDYDDLVQEGFIGLIKAAKTFKPDKGYRFSTYASRCIANQILMYCRETNKLQGMMYLDSPIVHSVGFENVCYKDNLLSKEPLQEDVMITKELKQVIEKYPIHLKRPKMYEEREAKIFELMCRGYRQCEIKDMVGISQRMASTHMSAIKERVEQVWFSNNY